MSVDFGVGRTGSVPCRWIFSPRKALSGQNPQTCPLPGAFLAFPAPTCARSSAPIGQIHRRAAILVRRHARGRGTFCYQPAFGGEKISATITKAPPRVLSSGESRKRASRQRRRALSLGTKPSGEPDGALGRSSRRRPVSYMEVCTSLGSKPASLMAAMICCLWSSP